VTRAVCIVNDQDTQAAVSMFLKGSDAGRGVLGPIPIQDDGIDQRRAHRGGGRIERASSEPSSSRHLDTTGLFVFTLLIGRAPRQSEAISHPDLLNWSTGL
jgi:hypothetical protein